MPPVIRMSLIYWWAEDLVNMHDNLSHSVCCAHKGEASSVKSRKNSSSPYPVQEWKEGNMGLYVHRNHEGLLGTGKLGGREFFVSNTYLLHCHNQNDSALRWAAV